MADSAIDGIFDLTQRYSGYDTKGTSSTTNTDYDPTVNYWGEKEKYDQLYEDKSTLSFTDMLGLMVAQFQNQTIDNQADTTDMMNQLVQMSSMQAMNEMTSQIKELTLANVMAYSASLVGQTVTIGVYNQETKELEEIVGVVEGCGTYDGQQVVFVGGKSYLLSSIMAVGKLPPKEETPEEDGDKVENPDGAEKPDGTEKPDDKVDQTPDTDTEDTGSGDESGKVPEVDNDNAVG